MENYSYKKTLKKGVKYFVLFTLPFLINVFVIQFPDIAQLSIGGLLVMGMNFLKHKVGVKGL